MTPGAVWSASDLEGDPHADSLKADKVRRMFGAIARSYDLNNRLHSFGRDQAWRRFGVRASGVTARDEVLDVACGTGDLARAFAAAGAARVTGLDFTPEMLEIAREKPPVRGSCALEYVQGDAMALPFGDGCFDVVSIAFGIRNVGDPAGALAEFRRVLRPGGRLIVLEFDRPRNPVIAALNDVYTRRVMPLTATLISRDRSGAYRYLPRSVRTFPGREAMEGAIRGAGFGDVRGTPLTFGVCVCYRGVVGVQ